MSTIAILLIIISAFIHAGWNILLKKENNSSLHFVLYFSFFSALCSLPFFFFLFKYIKLIPLNVFLFIIITGFMMAIYSFSLNKAYGLGEISFVYPVARALPIIFVAIITTLFALGKPLSIISIIGMAGIIFGCFILPMMSINNITSKNYINMSCLFCLTAALGTSGYSVIDDISINIFNNSPLLKKNLLKMTFLYAGFEFSSTFIWLLIFTLVFNIRNLKYIFTVKVNRKNAAIVGIGTFSGYFLVLIAMSFVTNVSYVVAFRQLSIPLGSIVGIIIFKEKKSIYKVAGIILLFTALITVAVN